MSFVVATASPPFTATGAIQVYAYEPFSYRFLFPPGSTFGNFSNTSTNLLGYLSVDATGVNFVGSNGFNSIVSSNGNALVIVDSAKNVYSNTVFGGAGRFTDASGNSVISRLVVYANEAFTPIPFYSFYVNLNPTTAFTQPTLPVAMSFYGSFSNSNLFYLGGQPAATTGASNYVLVASNTAGQVISANVNIQILPERLQLIGGPVTLPLTVGVPITPVTFTAIPPSASSNLTFTYPAVPSGLGFTDSSGNPVTTYPFKPPSDNKIVLAGTPTIATPTLGTQSITVPLRANVTSVFTGNLSNSTTITFNYTETVVFTTPSNNAVFSNAFVNLPITPIPFNAVSYFGGGQTVTSLSSPDLRSDLSLNSTSGVAMLSGTPTYAGSGTYTATAVSSSGVSGSIRFTFLSQNDVLTLSPFVDPSLNFIIGRPLDNPLPGYYSSNLTLTANSAAGQPITFVTEGFEASGITISPPTVTSSGTTITFSGVPTTLVSPTTGSVTASDGLLSVTRTVPFAVLNDVFTWSAATPTFLQNQVTAPIQISATTLSGRVLTSYFATGLPTGLVMSRTGLITGTCYGSTGGSFVVTGSTGISTQVSPRYTYSVIPDTLLLSAPAASYSLVPGDVVPPIPMTALLSSGALPSTFSLSGATYGLTVTSDGVLGGTLFSGEPPDLLLPTARITVNVRVGQVIVPTSIILTSSAIVVFGQLWAAANSLYVLYRYTTTFSDLFALTPLLLGTGAPQVNALTGDGSDITATSSDIQVNSSGRYVASLSGVDTFGTTMIGSVLAGNVGTTTTPTNTLLTTSNGSQTLYRSTFSIAYSGSGSVWYALGVGLNTNTANPNHVYLLKSSDNGETWTLGYVTTVAREPRNWALAVNPAYTASNPFIDWADDFFYATLDQQGRSLGSVVLRYSSAADIYMAGGGAGPDVEYSALRITSMTAPPPSFRELQATLVPTWTPVTPAAGMFGAETRDFAIDVPTGTPWVAAGSTVYFALTSVKTVPAKTLLWSSTTGLSWNITANDFTFTATAVTYGGGKWIALGSDNGFVYYAKSSLDGITWTNIALPNEAPLFFGSTVVYSNNTWMIFGNGALLYYNSSPTLNPASWVTVYLAADVSRASVGFSTVYPYATNSVLAISTIDPTIQLVTPANTAYSIMQYTFMTPITLTINRSPVYFFLTNDGLPNGIKFDSVTGTFSGMPLTAGTYAVRITAKSSQPTYNSFDFTFRIYSPYPQKRQDTASAFTSYVRQEAIIGGAQFSRDSNAFPSENTTVGAAMGPFPPEVNQAPKPCCLPLPSVKN